jgi:glycerophosphoryl diester phosphodiesterase
MVRLFFTPSAVIKNTNIGPPMKIQNHDKSKSLTSYPWQLERFFIRFIDLIFETWPRSVPSEKRLRQCKIVSHRGVYDNKAIMENTLEAFEGVKRSGIWGVEIDLRWTKDLVPVVIHDKSLDRLFETPVNVSQQTLSDIKSCFPMIPTLEEVVNQFGKDLHLMIEIKKEPYPDPVFQNRVLKHIFRGLRPKEDFHLLSLNPEMFDLISFVSPKTCLPIATKNVGALSSLALTRGYGGINGHYLLVTNAMISRHHQKNQKAGTGFVESVNCLFRELNRGIDWVFSNDAAQLQAQVDARLKIR